MVETKAFLVNPKHQCRVSQYREHDCSANNKKNRDYYEYPSLFYFTIEPSLYEKWWKRKAFPVNLKSQYRVSQREEHNCSAYNH